ncbi:MAG: porin family protein [Oligoflexia bacterium]|nr:porin family protein [Oligoflexia bacterium]
MMKLIFLILFAGFFSVHTVFAKSDMGLRLGVYGVYDQSALARPTGGKAYFTGTGYGIFGEMKATTNKGYGLGLRVSYEATNLDNNSNQATASENLATQYISIVPRLYGLDLFIGFGVMYSTLAYKQVSSGTTTTESYKGVGARLEFGYDWFLGKNIYVTPLITYGLSKVRADTSTVSSSYNPFGISLGLGVNF